MDRYDRKKIFAPTLEVKLLNLRAARMDTRDILQDLQDVAEGIQVTHAADNLKAAKAQKRARREAAKKRRIGKAERMILTHGWDDLDGVWRRRAEKLLDSERIEELHRQWLESMVQNEPAEMQTTLFEEGGR